MSRFLLVLSSPSGGGKSTIARKLMQGRGDVAFSVSATTRPMREGEVDGRDYHFLSEDEFEARVARGEFLEHARYGDYRYGTLVQEVEQIFAADKHAVLDIEIDGARQVRAHSDEAVLVFVLPPSGADLVARLRDRQTESGEQVRQRLARARAEMEAAREYDYIVVNDDLVVAVEQVAAILEAESLRRTRRSDLETVIRALQEGVTAAEAESPTS